MFERLKYAANSATAFFSRVAGWRGADPSSGDRALPPPETKSEDELLTPRKRLLLVAAARDSIRNTTLSPATAQQLKINVIGTQGGRLSITTDDVAWNDLAGKWFSRWSRHAEFTNAMHLNELLQLLLVQLTHTGGDCVLVFDDGALTGGTGSGKLRMFESDEIASINESIFAARYGAQEWTQSNGLIYDRWGRHIGCFVSSTQRGHSEFAEGTYLTLLRDPAEPPAAACWLYVGQFWRPNQGRGIPTSAHIVSAMDEIEQATSAELSAAKLNAHIALNLSESESSIPERDDIERGIARFAESSGNNGSGEINDEGAEEGEGDFDADAVADETVEFQMLKSGTAGVWSSPPGKKLSSFDTHRPNLRLSEFIRDVKGDAATVFGFGLLYVTLNPQQSYTAFRGAMLMAWGTFEQMQKKFERGVLDWIAAVALAWAAKMGHVEQLPEDYDANFAWSWPTMKEVNETDVQKALEKKFTNSETNLLQRHGADWRKFVDQQADEIEYCATRGVTHPSLRTANGGIAELVLEEGNNKGSDNE